MRVSLLQNGEQVEDRRFKVNVIQQGDITVYTTTFTADQLVAIGRVERFGEDPDGVNRKRHEDHAVKLAEFMVQPNAVLLDSICGDLRGDWRVEDGYLIAGPKAYLSLDDGQHRRSACELLNPDERARWSFPVVATQGLDYDTRLRIFRQQSKRRPIDRRLDLAMCHELNEWASDAERQAYELVLKLNEDEASPLKGKVLLGETVRREYRRAHQPEGINSAGLWSTLKSVLSKKSPLFALSVEKRTEVVFNLLTIASEVWPKAWDSENHVLVTGRGINAILKLIVSGANFRMMLGDDFRADSLRRALEMASTFNWTRKSLNNTGHPEMTTKIDEAIGRAYARKLASGQADVQA